MNLSFKVNQVTNSINLLSNELAEKFSVDSQLKTVEVEIKYDQIIDINVLEANCIDGDYYFTILTLRNDEKVMIVETIDSIFNDWNTLILELLLEAKSYEDFNQIRSSTSQLVFFKDQFDFEDQDEDFENIEENDEDIAA